jgi:hypothetical protein
LAKCGKAEKERRLNEIIDLIIKGYGRREILEYVSKNEWGIKRASVDLLIAEANEYFKKHAKIDRDKEVGTTLRRLHDLYQRAVDKGDLANARLILKDIRDMFGFDAPKTIDNDHLVTIRVLYGNHGQPEKAALPAGAIYRLPGKAESDTGWPAVRKDDGRVDSGDAGISQGEAGVVRDTDAGTD